MNKKISILLLFFTILYAKTIDSTHIKEKIKQLHKVANEAYKKDNYELSFSYYKKVLMIEQKIYGIEHIDTLDSYKQLSSIYFIMGEHEESLNYYKIITKIMVKEFGKDSIEMLNSYNNIALLYYAVKDYQKSIEYYTLVLDITLSQDVDNGVQAYHSLAFVYEGMGDYASALIYYKKVLEINLKKLPIKNTSTTVSYMKIGRTYNKMNNYNDALNYYIKALKTIDNKSSKNNTLLASIYTALGGVYMDIGNYVKSFYYLNKALDIRQIKFSKFHKRKQIVDTYNQLGLLYKTMGNYDKALSYHKKALNIEKNENDESLRLSVLYNNIALDYSLSKNYKLALSYHKKVLKIRKEFLIKNHIEIAMTYNHIANSLDNLMDYDEAFIYAKKALTIFDDVKNKHSIKIAYIYNTMALIYLHIHNNIDALKYFKKALIIFEQESISNDIATIYNNISSVYFELKDYTNAYFYINKSFDILTKNKTINNIILDNLQKQNYKNLNDNLPTLFLRSKRYISQLKKENNHTQIEKIQQKTLNYYLKDKGLVTESSNILAMMEQNTDKETKKDIKNYKELNIALSNLFDDKENDNTEQIKYLKEQISQLEIKLNKSSAKFREFKNLHNISEQNITQILKDDELYIDFAKTDEYYYIFTLDKSNKITFEQISKEQKTILNQKIQEFRVYNHKIASQKKEERAKVDKVQEKKDTQKLLYQIYNILSQHIDFKSKKSLIISPDGLLNFLPFEALYDGEKYLIESVSISYTPSGRELVRQDRREKVKNSSDDIVVFAHPDYDASDKKRNPQDYNQTDTKSWTMGYLYDLNGSKDEAKIIKELYPKARLFEDKEATVEKLFEIKSPKILHISTHGAFIDDKNITNPMEQIFLAFVDANLMVMETNATGIATALKLSSLELANTELVFLSACETGLGTVQTAEGVQGLPKAFIQAGAKNIIMSLWQVDDAKTAELTRYFYENIKGGMGYKEALREAKLKMIDIHPYYWSGFVFSGI